MVKLDLPWLKWLIWPIDSFKEWCLSLRPRKKQENTNPFLIVKDYTRPITPEVEEETKSEEP